MLLNPNSLFQAGNLPVTTSYSLLVNDVALPHFNPLGKFGQFGTPHGAPISISVA